ncbi:surface antigen family protein [Anaplasma phagocytophilum str. ApNP]|uniref:Surface antigen family protein n=1 Tax=Anaplasma phagocytophilum str. ApNP TaxID=1359153 RepID=A0A0F3NJS8_ANAPH|nr:surface antigen family protein [Anaplasma phagocytophilum str. ApNP]
MGYLGIYIRYKGGTQAVYPYLKDGKSVKLESNKFDWNTPDPRIGFKDNMLVAMEGSVGYGIGGARVELERALQDQGY